MKFTRIIEIIDEMTWEDCKAGGADHYKSTKKSVEPIDLYKSRGTLRAFAIDSIIKYADRNIDSSKPFNVRDLDKIIHYACMLRVSKGEI